MKWHIRAIALTLATLVSGAALADGRSATHNLFANMSRAGASISNFNENNVLVSPTLVKGMYALTDQQGRLVGYVNEAGTLYGDSRGFTVVSINGAQPRPLAPAEAKDLRFEIMSAIDYDKLPKITHGNGGGRQVLMFSAVDCPYCKTLEDNMRKESGGLNSTIYVVPSSLQNLAQGGLQQWQTVSRIWCAENAGPAWQAFWASHAVPQQRQCAFADPQIAQRAGRQLKDMLKAVGTDVYGTPVLIREDGVTLRIQNKMNAAEIVALLGPSGAPAPNNAEPRWLASVDNSFQAQAVNGQPMVQQPGAQPAQQNGKVNLNEVLNLKKLFGK